MENYRAVIVDDEEPGRDVVAEYLQEYGHIGISESFASPSRALEYLRDHAVDILFLDIQMPGMNGFDLLEQMDSLPHVIFSTAHDEYALKAFEVSAVDYLLKPYTPERFREALDKVLSRNEPDQQQEERIKALIRQYRSPDTYPDRIFVRTGTRIVPVAVRDIVRICAEGDYSRIHTEEEEYLSGTGLGDLEQKLDSDLFRRSHRSYILAVNKLKSLESDGGGGYTGHMSDGSTVRISRSRANGIKQLIV